MKQDVYKRQLLLFASMMKYETIMPYKEEVKKLYARMSEADKQTGDGQEITAYVYPPATVGVGDMMVDGCLLYTSYTVFINSNCPFSC